MSGRGTRYDPNAVRAIQPGSFSDNIFSQIRETLTPSDSTIDLRFTILKQKIKALHRECGRLSKETVSLQSQAALALSRGSEVTARALIVQKKICETQLEKYMFILQTLEAGKSSAAVAKNNVGVAEAFKLIDNVLLEYNKSVSKNDASYTLTDVENKSRKADAAASVFGQAVTEDQKDAEKRVDEELESLKEQVADQLELELPIVSDDNPNSGGSTALRVKSGRRKRHEGRGGGGSGNDGLAVLEAEFSGGGAVAVRKNKPTTNNYRKKRPSTPPPPSSSSGFNEAQLEDLLPHAPIHPIPGRRSPPPPPAQPPNNQGNSAVGYDRLGSSPPPFDQARHSRGAGGEADTGRQSTPSPRQRQETLHPLIPANDNDGEDDDEEEVALKRRSKKDRTTTTSGHKKSHKRELNSKKRPNSSSPTLPDDTHMASPFTSSYSTHQLPSPVSVAFQREEPKDARLMASFRDQHHRESLMEPKMSVSSLPTPKDFMQGFAKTNTSPFTPDSEALYDELLIDDE